MKCKRSLTKTNISIFRIIVIITLIVTLYCFVMLYFPPSTMLCTSRQIAYTKANSSESIFVGEKSKYKDLQTVHEILESYQRFHKCQRSKLLNEEPTHTLTWYCVSDCNGIGDRIRGIYSAFLLALAMNRTFFIHLSDQVQESMFIEPNAIDWRPVSSCSTLHPDQTLDSFNKFNLKYIQREVFHVIEDFESEINRLKTKENIFLSWRRTIWDLIRDIYHSQIAIHNQPLQKLFQAMLQPGTDQDLYHFLSALHQFLFHVPLVLEKEVNSTMKNFNLQRRRFVSLHIRTGFKNTFIGEIVIGKDFFNGNRFPRTKAHWRQMMDCAINIADSELGNDSVILVSSDDEEPKAWAAKEYELRVKLLDIHPVHVGKKVILGDYFSKVNKEAFLQNWVELSVMSQALAIVGIPSGFSEVAGIMGPIDPSFFYFYELSKKKCLYFTTSNWAHEI